MNLQRFDLLCTSSLQGLEEVRRTTCANCNNKGVSPDNSQLLRCTKCKFFRYCSKECQQQHWLKHKTKCIQFDLAVQRSSPETMPLFYLYYTFQFTHIDEFLYAARKHREALIAKIKQVKGEGDVSMQASWVRIPLTVDGNNRHLVIYLTFIDHITEEPSDQTFYRVFLVGPTSVQDTNGRGLEMLNQSKRELDEQGIKCTSVVVGAGFDQPGVNVRM